MIYEEKSLVFYEKLSKVINDNPYGDVGSLLKDRRALQLSLKYEEHQRRKVSGEKDILLKEICSLEQTLKERERTFEESKKKTVAYYEEQLCQLKSENQQKEIKRSELEDQLQNLKSQASLDQRLDHISKEMTLRINKLENENKSLRKTSQELKQENKTKIIQTKLSSLQTQHKELRAILNDKQQIIDNYRLTETNMRNKIDELSRKCYDLSKILVEKNEKLSQQQTNENGLNTELANTQKQLNEEKKKVKFLYEKCEQVYAISSNISNLKDMCNKYKLKFTDLSKKYYDAKKETVKLKRTIQKQKDLLMSQKSKITPFVAERKLLLAKIKTLESKLLSKDSVEAGKELKNMHIKPVMQTINAPQTQIIDKSARLVKKHSVDLNIKNRNISLDSTNNLHNQQLLSKVQEPNNKALSPLRHLSLSQQQQDLTLATGDKDLTLATSDKDLTLVTDDKDKKTKEEVDIKENENLPEEGDKALDDSSNNKIEEVANYSGEEFEESNSCKTNEMSSKSQSSNLQNGISEDGSNKNEFEDSDAGSIQDGVSLEETIEELSSCHDDNLEIELSEKQKEKLDYDETTEIRSSRPLVIDHETNQGCNQVTHDQEIKDKADKDFTDEKVDGHQLSEQFPGLQPVLSSMKDHQDSMNKNDFDNKSESEDFSFTRINDNIKLTLPEFGIQETGEVTKNYSESKRVKPIYNHNRPLPVQNQFNYDQSKQKIEDTTEDPRKILSDNLPTKKITSLESASDERTARNIKDSKAIGAEVKEKKKKGKKKKMVSAQDIFGANPTKKKTKSLGVEKIPFGNPKSIMGAPGLGDAPQLAVGLNAPALNSTSKLKVKSKGKKSSKKSIGRNLQNDVNSLFDSLL